MPNKQQYTLDIFEQVGRFRQYHYRYADPLIPQAAQEEYIAMVLEQMLAHFEYEHVAVQMFVAHYGQLLTDPSVSPRFKYHPLRFLRQLDNQDYQHYLYALYGFAEDMYKLLQSHRMYSQNGILLAGYEHFANDTLYLMIRPEVPDVLRY